MILHKLIKFLSKAFLIKLNSQNEKFLQDLNFFIRVNVLAGTLAWCLALPLGRIQDVGAGLVFFHIPCAYSSISMFLLGDGNLA
jgi:hypothetical protein